MTAPVVSIAYHSGYGHTAVLAEAVRDGAAEAGATVHFIKVDAITEADWDLLDASDAIVFGSPTYMGTASGAFHQFAEATSKRWFTGAWLDKIAHAASPTPAPRAATRATPCSTSRRWPPSTACTG